MPAPHVAPSRSPRRPGARTALLLVIAALAMVAATVGLVLMGPRDRTPDFRTVSVAPLEPPPDPRGGDGRAIHSQSTEILTAEGSIVAEVIGRSLDGKDGLVWLPSTGMARAADVDLTGTVRWADAGFDSLIYEVIVPGREADDTIRVGGSPIQVAAPPHSDDVADALVHGVLRSLGGGGPSRDPTDLSVVDRMPAGVDLPSRRLRARHGKTWNEALWLDLVDRRDRAPIVERAILGAIEIPELAARLDSLEAVAVRFDTYWPAFWLYADELVHYGALAGRPVDATVDTLRSAIERVPRPWSTRLIRHRDALAALRADTPAGAPGWAARGAWDSAFVRSTPSPDADAGDLLDAYRLAVVGNWLGGVPPSAVAVRRRPVREEHLDAAGGAELAWLDGLAAAVAQDGDAIDRARLRLGESSAPSATDLERSLRAFQLATVEGEELRGARLLRSLERERASRLRLAMIEDDGHPYLTGVNRLAAAQWFIKHGRSSDALPLLGWWERLPVGAPGIEIADAVLAPVDELQRARAYREVGRPGDAARHFRRFLDGYDLAEGAHRTWVRDARAALAGRH